MEPEAVEGIGVLSGNARHSPWGIAFNTAQRMAIEADPTWQDASTTAGSRGLAAARAIGMISYRSYQRFQETQQDPDGILDGYRADSYERYQGEKLVRRFNAQSYWVLSKAMDSHHVGRVRGPIPDVLKQVKARALIMGVSTDLLFPAREQKFLSENLPNAEYHEIESPYGHDGFLIEFDQMERILRGFLTG
jgi:homoserine O-acetyltransferase